MYARPYPRMHGRRFTRADALIVIFIKRPDSGEPQDEYCCGISL